MMNVSYSPFHTLFFSMKHSLIVSSILSLFIMVMIALSMPTQAYAGCTCIPTGRGAEYEKGTWQEDGTGMRCDKCIYGTNGPAPDPTTVTCSTTCNPLTEGSINVGFRVPTFAELIGNVIRLFFFVAGLVALVFLLLGGFEWVSSGGDPKKTDAARAKITSAVIGLVIMIAVLSLVIFLEQVVFGGKICLGISCPMNIGFMQLIR